MAAGTPARSERSKEGGVLQLFRDVLLWGFVAAALTFVAVWLWFALG